LNDSDLNFSNHSRDSAGLKYVYPVVSRRAGGVSVGINLNTNNACNWRCIYCQVPDLKIGTAPVIDLQLLEVELRGFLLELLHGDFMQKRVPENSRRINDIALSGNGEPTSAKEFFKVIELICKLRQELSLPADIKLVLISNGSLMHREQVQEGLKLMSQCNGEVWFKLDRASEVGMSLVNNTQQKLDQARQNLLIATTLCETWLQTCWFAIDGSPPSTHDENMYLDFISEFLTGQSKPLGVLLYTLARPSLQVEASRLSALTISQLESFAERIRSLGFLVKVSA
jgi:wyosine [tRNA(Phe)-imidazoG37] synthetase (radical SAM superfamily)